MTRPFRRYLERGSNSPRAVIGPMVLIRRFVGANGSEAEGWEGACPRKEGVQCEKTEAAIEQPIAASAWKLYGTRPSLKNLCVLRAVRAAGGRSRCRRGTLCAGRCTLGRLFGIRVAARPCAWRYAIAHCMRDKFHVTNSWQSSHMTRRTAEGQNMELASHLFEEGTRLLMNPRFNMSRSKGWDPLGFDSK